jgi:hypothetical protein
VLQGRRAERPQSAQFFRGALIQSLMGGHYTNRKNPARGSGASGTELVCATGDQVGAKTANETRVKTPEDS